MGGVRRPDTKYFAGHRTKKFVGHLTKKYFAEHRIPKIFADTGHQAPLATDTKNFAGHHRHRPSMLKPTIAAYTI